MRRRIALSLFVTLLLTVVLTPLTEVPAYAADNVKQIISAIGIMETDQGSNVDTAVTVTRSRFAQMLVNASSLKDTVASESSVSLFSDVKKNYWAAGYIQTAVTQGWMSGYLNGKFKPKQGITLQEAVYAAVKLLGYTSSDFTGNLSTGIMSLYKTKGLNENISKTKTQYLTVKDCSYLFYNILTATSKNGNIYAVSLGYAVDSYGELDYLSLVSTSIKGPIIADEDWKTELPFSTAQAVFYKDGVKCSTSDISDYDVLYYTESLKTVWVYDNKETGTVESINPDYSTPQSVTISGKTYTFADSEVSIKFSSLGEVKEDNIVTLVLDKNNIVVDVLSVDEYNTTVTGLVTETGSHLVQVNGSYVNRNYIVFVDAAGNKYQQDYDKTSILFYTGDIARLTFSNGTASVSKITLTSTSFGNNTFNSDGSSLGNVALASNVKILDVAANQYISVSTARLAGVTLTESTVYYYELNKNGEISQLILNNVTGDMNKYGVFTGYTFQAASDKANYNYLIGSESGSFNTSSFINLSTDKGPKSFSFSDNTLTASYSLTEVAVTSIGATTIQAGSVKIAMSEKCHVYQLVNGEYVATTIDKISDLTKFSVKAYYDKSTTAGGRIRVIVAESI